MQISVLITSEEYESLITHAPEESSASRALSRAAIVSQIDGDGISQNYEIECDEAGANALLALAQIHSPSAFQKINAAMGGTPIAEK